LVRRQRQRSTTLAPCTRIHFRIRGYTVRARTELN
jgi:hypothetical protein